MLAGELDALLLTVILPVAAPIAEGAKVAVNVVDCPGSRISPLDPPVESNPAPATKTCEMVTLAFPALVSVTSLTLLLETVTLPKLKLLALELSSSCVGVAGAVPDTEPQDARASEHKVISEAAKFFFAICTVRPPFQSRTGHLFESRRVCLFGEIWKRGYPKQMQNRVRCGRRLLVRGAE
jgi:hypothetical protein